MSKFKYKQLVIGFISGAIVMTASSGFASEAIEKVDAYLNSSIPVIVDGKQIELSKPIAVIDGSSYVPLKVIGEALNKDVTWNDKTKSIELTSVIDPSKAIPSKDINQGNNVGTTTTQPVSSIPPTTNSSLSTGVSNSDSQPTEIKEYFHGSDIHSAYKFNDTIYLTIGNGSEKYGLDKRDFNYNDTDKTITYKGKVFKILPKFVIDCDAFIVNGVTYYKESIFSES